MNETSHRKLESRLLKRSGYISIGLGLPSPEAESGESEPVHAACLENALGGRGRREAGQSGGQNWTGFQLEAALA